ncbi:hypothetical protein BH09PLA1_BH09PLA1_19230 [soil metagenome]
MGKFILMVAVVVLAYLCGIGWYMEQGHRAMAAADSYEVWAKQQRMIQVEFIVSPPDATLEGESLYLCGRAPALGGFAPAGVKLVRSSDGKYRAAVELLSGIEQLFCVTRGSYESIEADPTEGRPHWRSEVIVGRDAVELKVSCWADNAPNAAVSRVGCARQ